MLLLRGVQSDTLRKDAESNCDNKLFIKSSFQLHWAQYDVEKYDNHNKWLLSHHKKAPESWPLLQDLALLFGDDS